MDNIKNWKEKRMFFIHEQNSGVSLIKGNLNLIKKYIKLHNDSKISLNELLIEVEGCIERSNSGIKIIKDSQDYIYNQIKEL